MTTPNRPPLNSNPRRTMTTDLRALCAKLVEKVECTWGEGIPADVWELLARARARALLAQLEDGTLTNEELRTVMPVNLRGDEEDALAFARAVEAAVIARVVWAAAASAHQIQPTPPAEGEVGEAERGDD